MNDMNFETARHNMIEQQIRPWNVLDQHSLDALKHVPREDFVPKAFKKMAFSDVQIPLANNQTMLAPKIEAHILQAVQVQANDHVLEVGTGTGFLTALLAEKAKKVTSLEIFPELTNQAQKNIDQQGISNVQLETRDAAHGYASSINYDVIVLSGAMPDVPMDYKKLLSQGGRLFAVTGESPNMSARLLTRVADDQWSDVVLFETELDMLVNAEEKESFKF